MARLEMEFRGICMHLSESTTRLPEGVRHRVVAVNADQGAICTLPDQPLLELPPHHKYLEAEDEIAGVVAGAGLESVPPSYRPPGLAAFRMKGTRIRVENAKEVPLSVDFRHLPHLTHYAPDMQLRPDLAEAKVPLFGDCFVDIRHGCIWDSIYLEGGVYTRWTVETDGDPVLVFETEGQETRWVTIPADGCRPVRLCLRNGTPDLCNEQYDFALYYLAAVGGIEAQTFVHLLPGEPSPEAPTATDVDTTTSCSNSGYP